VIVNVDSTAVSIHKRDKKAVTIIKIGSFWTQLFINEWYTFCTFCGNKKWLS